jgi:hypothetical protein
MANEKQRRTRVTARRIFHATHRSRRPLPPLKPHSRCSFTPHFRFGPRTGIPVRGLCVPVEFAGRGVRAIPGPSPLAPALLIATHPNSEFLPTRSQQATSQILIAALNSFPLSPPHSALRPRSTTQGISNRFTCRLEIAVSHSKQTIATLPNRPKTHPFLFASPLPPDTSAQSSRLSAPKWDAKITGTHTIERDPVCGTVADPYRTRRCDRAPHPARSSQVLEMGLHNILARFSTGLVRSCEWRAT